ncbi:uncharacterized protein LOC111292573 [Durio zibethinus]|uniref:Uncharacterized protein LOC111292573 n=1 Tax=Durio zibethinus TaxID=66656 RepID=A0A6P5YJQ0_DURZI|nr:uncharacterized protein LOC111292573 [Durio zibethinus]
MEAYSSSSSKVQQPFHASLHSVRKPLAKPCKKPIAPFPPKPPKVYKVDPINFRYLVQKLTGAPEFMSQSHHQKLSTTSQLQLQPRHHLRRVAPRPLNVVAASPLSGAEVSAPFDLISGLDHTKSQNQQFSDNAMITSNSLGFNLSPSSYNWCAFPILSPGTLSSLEQSTVP